MDFSRSRHCGKIKTFGFLGMCVIVRLMELWATLFAECGNVFYLMVGTKYILRTHHARFMEYIYYVIDYYDFSFYDMLNECIRISTKL